MPEEKFLEHHRRGADEYMLPDAPGQHRCVKCGKTKAIELFFRSVEGYPTRSDVWRTCNECWDGALDRARKAATVAIGIETGQIPAPPTKKEELEKKGMRFCTNCKGTYPFKMFTRRDKVRRLSCNECAAKKSAAWRESRERKKESEARSRRKPRGGKKYDKVSARCLLPLAFSRDVVGKLMTRLAVTGRVTFVWRTTCRHSVSGIGLGFSYGIRIERRLE